MQKNTTKQLLIGLALLVCTVLGLFLLYYTTKEFFYVTMSVSVFMLKLYALSIGLFVTSWIISVYLLVGAFYHKKPGATQEELVESVCAKAPNSKKIAKTLVRLMDDKK